jgi:hypothetical protein
MNSRAAAVFLALGSLTTSLVAASALDDPLWAKAIGIASANSNWVPGLVIIRSEVLQGGKSEGVHEVWQRSSSGEKGEVITQTVKVLEDGKDVTAREKKKIDTKADHKVTAKLGGHPFELKVQERLILKPTQQTKVISNKTCVAYEFELRNTNGVVTRGVGWLEKETGWPAEIENMTMSPLPDKHFKRMGITTRYEAGPEGRWQAKEVITTGTVSVMFIKADIRSTTTFSEYWKKKE